MYVEFSVVIGGLPSFGGMVAVWWGLFDVTMDGGIWFFSVLSVLHSVCMLLSEQFYLHHRTLVLAFFVTVRFNVSCYSSG